VFTQLPSYRIRPLAAAICCALAVLPITVQAVEFRTIDGSGNNLNVPSQGAANTRVIRFGYDADYPDGIGDVIADAAKPNPRDVSNRALAQAGNIPNARGLTDWSVHWGQFLTHDISLVDNGAQYDALSSGAIGNFNIPITDPTDPLGPNPISFHRSAFDPATGNGDVIVTPRGTIPIPRSLINSNTSYIDASQVYGSDQATADSIRTFADGKLATSAGGLLPMIDAENRFVAGDNRVNENVGLTAIHALFVREHNRLADRIQAHDPALGDEQVYQWARKIVGAEMQAITYREYLPAVMGDGAPRVEDFFYDEIDASITTAFTAGAFRFGHSMQSPRILLVDNANQEVGAIGLATATENPDYLTSDPARVDLILKGLAAQTAQENDAYIIGGLRNLRFGPPGTGGTDLAAIDIQRGRDLGLLNNYRLMRQAYSLGPLHSFNELTSDVALAAKLEEIYGSVENLDGWVAMIAEDHLPGSSLGPLTHAILTSQFTRLRDGDRFFFTGDPDLQSELVRAVVDLDSITLSQIIRFNSGITSLPSNVFLAVPEPNAACALLALATTLAMLRLRTEVV
jgi:hypothetical protein